MLDTIPIPGFRTAPQVKENTPVLELEPMTKAQMAEIEQLIRQPQHPMKRAEDNA